ncbi:MAG: multicopper oxidase domain-containing protein [Rhodospirillaceae bacterium]|jgi:FtsP/CotA-like multicopper oxidase with cupredoxin domain|nr:multicopper oxidase domain-containing protein [Rhodospirillaceae bacterium]MBT4905853.1 multicopper oxidase domain-containing protein [Rhodospirillaceae bacterium]MBT5357160.1 multicopper oxidase domain-containing protein [Rhodospirillaceae bacterium]MBT5770384.1 multicopper oxidase domain-containing protein [Rhodospirillaceae bacterium]MBT6310983.1 multicopper oxidase domain-containing protein [Rhodospirillaceae bacterium]
MRRRGFLKLGAGIAAGMPSLMGGGAAAQLVSPGNLPPDLEVRPSPPTTPFLAPLQIPAIKQPINGAGLVPAPDPARHQRYDEFPPAKFYELHERAFLHTYHPELPPTPSWGYDGSVPGPTFHARYGEPFLVRRFNDLPADHTGYGLPSTTMHLHNMHAASESDGFPIDFIDSGEWWDHHYCMFPAGMDPREKLTLLWYHDHRMDFTAANVYAGLTGFCLFFDEHDTGDENDTSPLAWRLPSGKYDVPLIIHDVLFDVKGNAVFDIFNTEGFLGDKMTINRIIQPYLNVEPRKYRFRLLNGGPSRFYSMVLSTGQKFVVLSNDGNMMPAPVEVDRLPMAVANRYDLIIDFSRYRPGEHVDLVNILEQFDGGGPTGRILDPGMPMMRFNVIEATGPDNSRIPERMRELPPVDLSEVRAHREWDFDYTGGMWTINGKHADMMNSDADIQEGSAEIWTLRNAGSTWSHPVHIHFEEFQILEINGRPIAPGSLLNSRKDTFWLGPNQTAKLFFRFRDFHGRYILHCHNVVHEDHAMMLRWDILENLA